MNMPASPPIVRAVISRDGLLLEADGPLLELQREAGGDLNEPVAIPQIAMIARLAARLGVTLSRPVVAAAERADIDMWVRAKPDQAGVSLSVIDWHERTRLDRPVDMARRDAEISAQCEGWIWQIDTQLRFELVMEGDEGDSALPTPSPVAGTRFSRYFQLLADDEGDMAMLRGLAQRRAFRDQDATLMVDPDRHFRLSGFPLFDLEGRLTGYRGSAVAADHAAQTTAPVASDTPPSTFYPAEFGKRLDRSLRQPLGRIVANADTISAQLEGPLRDDYAGYAKDIATAGRHLMALVDDLADLQAIDRPDFTVFAEDVDLADLGRRAAGLLAVKALDRRIAIVAPDMDATVAATGEFRRILQILVNLVGNAVRYSPEDTEVRIVTACQDGQATISVIDQGPGIDPADRERIFEKFERLGRDDASGSGLGLYISRRLARAMGGDIHIGGEPGQGAQFTLALPAR